LMRKYVYDVFFTCNSNTIYVQKLDLNDHVQYCYREVYTVLFFVIVLRKIPAYLLSILK
jgi:hypothetical protein